MIYSQIVNHSISFIVCVVPKMLNCACVLRILSDYSKIFQGSCVPLVYHIWGSLAGGCPAVDCTARK